jgi:hypothetical protein
MSAMLSTELRRYWQPLIAVAALLGFLVAHFFVFQTAQSRLDAAIRRTQALGGPADPEHPRPTMPSRVATLLADNAKPENVARREGESGALAAELLEQLSEIANRHGMEVVATEPSATVQQDRAVQIKAHVRARCSYQQFVGFLDELSRGKSLISVDRFSLESRGSVRRELDLYVTRYLIKRPVTQS